MFVLLFKSPTKREIRQFHVEVVQWKQRNVQRSVLHVQSCCFVNLNLLLFWRSHCRRRCLSSLWAARQSSYTWQNRTSHATPVTAHKLQVFMSLFKPTRPSFHFTLYNDVNASRTVIGRCQWSIRVRHGKLARGFEYVCEIISDLASESLAKEFSRSYLQRRKMESSWQLKNA